MASRYTCCILCRKLPPTGKNELASVVFTKGSDSLAPTTTLATFTASTFTLAPAFASALAPLEGTYTDVDL